MAKRPGFASVFICLYFRLRCKAFVQNIVYFTTSTLLTAKYINLTLQIYGANTWSIQTRSPNCMCESWLLFILHKYRMASVDHTYLHVIVCITMNAELDTGRGSGQTVNNSKGRLKFQGSHFGMSNQAMRGRHKNGYTTISTSMCLKAFACIIFKSDFWQKTKSHTKERLSAELVYIWIRIIMLSLFALRTEPVRVFWEFNFVGTKLDFAIESIGSA